MKYKPKHDLKAAVTRVRNAGPAGLLVLLIMVCVTSMAGVAGLYHMALGHAEKTAGKTASAAHEGFKSSYALIESLSLAQNAIQKLLRERDPDQLEKLVMDLDARQEDLARRIKSIGERGAEIRVAFTAWRGICGSIVQTFLRGENAEANSQLVNRLMPESERVLMAVRHVNEANDRDSAARVRELEEQLGSMRNRAIGLVAIVIVTIIAGGVALRSRVARGMGAVAETLGRLTTLRAANEILEDRVRERTLQIERGNAQMAAIQQASLDGILVLDSQWRIMEANHAAARSLGKEESQLSGMQLEDFVAPAFPDYNAQAKLPLERLVEVAVKRDDGGEFPAEIAVTQARLDGPPVYVASLRDITERKRAEAEREELNNRLLAASRQAGMAEVATGVLHNVGNVLNSVNVSATMVSDKLRRSEVASVIKVADLVRANRGNLAGFMTTDERGKLLPQFILDLAQCLSQEQEGLLAEMSSLARGIEHIKQIVTAQQSLARQGAVLMNVEPSSLMESALNMQGGALERFGIEVEKRFDRVPAVPIDQHKVLQILINLISNAKHAVKESDATTRRITLVVRELSGPPDRRLCFEVIDNGMGIAHENLSRIFSMGFTTKSGGHGFGLHSAANAAREMGGELRGSSEGINKGAVFTLELPVAAERMGETCRS